MYLWDVFKKVHELHHQMQREIEANLDKIQGLIEIESSKRLCDVQCLIGKVVALN